MSALAQLGGQACAALVLTEPRSGRWHAHFAVQPEQQPEAQSSLRIGADTAQRELLGTIKTDYDATFGIFVGVIRGGRGDVSRPGSPRHYRSSSVRSVVSDLVAAAGETLAADADASILGSSLEMYSVTTAAVGAQLTKLLREVGAVWRFKSNGDLWVGADAWNPYEGDVQVLLFSPIENCVEVDYGDSAPLISPGQSFQGKHVSYVEHRVDERGGPRGRIFFEVATP